MNNYEFIKTLSDTEISIMLAKLVNCDTCPENTLCMNNIETSSDCEMYLLELLKMSNSKYDFVNKFLSKSNCVR